MSEQTKIVSCPVCGAKLTEEDRFCSSCGEQIMTATEVPTEPNTDSAAPDETNTDTAPEEQKPALNEVENDLDDDTDTEDDTAEEIVDTNRLEPASPEDDVPAALDNVSVAKARLSLGDILVFISSTRIVNRIVSLSLAFILLIFAFCPVAYSVAKTGEDTSVMLSFNTVDSVVLAVRSFFFMDDGELSETDLYAKLQGETSEKGALKKSFELMTMSKDIMPRLTVILTAIVSLAYVCLCIVFLVLAIIDLLTEIFTVKRARGCEYICRRPSDRMLIAVLCFIPILIFSFVQMCHFGVGEAYAPYTGGGVGLAFGGIVSLILTILGAIFICIKNTIALSSMTRGYFNKGIAKNIVCCALVLIMVLSVFMPCITMVITDPVTDESTLIGVSKTDIYELNGGDIDYYRVMSSSSSRKELNTQMEKALDSWFGRVALSESMLSNLLIGIGRNDVRVLYLAILFITFITLILTCVLLWCFLNKVFFMARLGGFIKFLRAITFCWAIVDLIAVIVLNVFIQLSLGGDLILYITPIIGVGTVLMIMCAFVSLFLRVNPKEVKCIDRRYDNPDISYAPYVIEKRR